MDTSCVMLVFKAPLDFFPFWFTALAVSFSLPALVILEVESARI